MPLFIVKNNPGFLKPLVLEKEDEHHLVRVMRAKAGQTLTITDNHGSLAMVQISFDVHCRGKKSFAPTFQIISQAVCPPPHPLTVCLPLIDQTRLEWAVEKLCELNVQTVQLISTERTQVRATGRSPLLSAKKMERLHKIAEAAQKQCERAWPLKIMGAVALQHFTFEDGTRYFVGLVPQGTDAHGQTRTNTDLHRPATSNQRPATLFIGPEGGFTDAEIDFFTKKNVESLSLPTNILRTETAAIALATVITTFSFRYM